MHNSFIQLTPSPLIKLPSQNVSPTPHHHHNIHSISSTSNQRTENATIYAPVRSNHLPEH